MKSSGAFYFDRPTSSQRELLQRVRRRQSELLRALQNFARLERKYFDQSIG
jgi:hypothetical protein